MRTITLLFIISFFINGVVGDEVKSVSMMEGDSLTLHTDITEIKADEDLIATWTFGPQKTKIAQINKEAKKPPTYEDVQIFKNRLKLNSQNGDLTITNIRTEQAGLYNVRINFKKKIILKSFSVDGVRNPESDQLKSVSVKDGDFVTLLADDRDIKKYDVMQWRFQGIRIAHFNKSASEISEDERFRDKLQLDVQTGSLKIKNIRTDLSGLYQVDLTSTTTSSSYTIHQTFNVTVSGEVKSVSAMKGDPLIINTDVPDIKTYDRILFIFGCDDTIADVNRHFQNKQFTLDGKDRDRLKLNDQTGDLTITKIKIEDAGDYELKMSSSRRTIQRRFRVNVSERGLSPSAVAGLSVFFLLFIAAAAAAGVIFYRRKIAELLGETKILVVDEWKSVDLKTEIKDIKRDDLIEWRFGETLIAKINPANNISSTYDDYYGLFRDKLKLNHQTGDLTISDFREKHAGVYKLKITRGGKTSFKRFSVFVRERIVVYEGEFVPLKTEVNDIQRVDLIEWRFGDKETLIAEINPANNIFSTYNGDDDLFRDKLKLNDQTGDLNINDIRQKHAGVYKLKIIRDGETSYKRFRVHVRVLGRTKELLVQEDTVDLETEVTDIKRDDVIEWRFRETLIAQINFANNIFSTSDDDKGLFKGILKLNHQTGDLTISDFREEHAGVYTLKIIKDGETTYSKLIVFVIGAVEQLHVNEGDYYTLKTKVTDIKRGDVIKWKYGYEQTLIAQINPAHNIFSTYDDRWEFINKLELNPQTGDLTIFDIREVEYMEGIGEIILEIIRDGKTTYRRFNVTIINTTKELQVIEGKSADLKTEVTDIQKDEKIEWRFRDEYGEDDEEFLIAEISPANNISSTYDGVNDLFRDKLKLNPQTGDLNIKDIREKHTGDYTLKITRDGKPTYRRFTVFVRYEIEEVLPVNKGDSVHLKTDLEIKRDDLIEWRFGDKETLIAKINPVNNIFSTYDGDDDLFRDKLKLNPQTGDLNINDFRHEHDGYYKLKIIKDGETPYKRFNVYAWIVMDFTDKSKNLNVNKGESVDLKTYLTDIQRVDLIEWRFKETLIAEINPANNIFRTSDQGLFRDKLKLNPQTGDLNINDIREKHTGGYTLKIIRDGETSDKKFFVNFINHFNKPFLNMGESVHLKTEVTDIQRDEKIEWTFTKRSTFKETLIAEINPANNICSTYNGVDDLFRDKLNLNPQTGDLTINDIIWEHNGEYELKIIRDEKSSYKRFEVYVMVVMSETLEVYEESSVDMKTDLTDIQRDEKIEWRFVDTMRSTNKETLIAEINPAKNIFSTYDGDDDLFRDKLNLNNKTGDLNIKDIREKHTGGYEVKIIRDDKSSYKRFYLPVRLKPKELQVKEGESVHMMSDLTAIQRDEKIEWRFEETLIAKIYFANNIFSTYDGDDDLFKDKLKLNHKTGDLTINDFRQKHNGVYTLEILRSGKTSYKKFIVNVKASKRGDPVETRGHPVETREDPVETRGHPVETRVGYSVEIEMPLLNNSNQ